MDRSRKFLRLPSVSEKVGLSRSQIYKLIQQGEFPKPIKLGPKISVWIEEKLEAWMDAKIPQ
jgi:prophage regulatory protein